MSRGVTLVAIGGYGYMQWAINMAVSLRYHSPAVAIQLITSQILKPNAYAIAGLFDEVTIVSDSAFTDEQGRLFPAKLKTSLYSYLHFDETIYLDVDGVIIKDITPLFAQTEDFGTDVQAIYDLSQGEVFNAMKWATPAVTWFHFGLKPTDQLPAINSSYLFIRKGETCEALYKLAHELLMNNPLPVDQHWHPWGIKRKTKNQQPDELYMNVALAMLKTPVHHCGAIHFRLRTETGDYLPIESIRNSCYGIGLFGELRSNHLSLLDHYNNEMKKCWTAIVSNKLGGAFYNKCENLAGSKFAVQ